MNSPDQDTFTLVERTVNYPHSVYDDFRAFQSGLGVDTDVKIQAALRKQYPGYNLTAVPNSNCNLLHYAAVGNATAKIDNDTETTVQFRGYIPSPTRGVKGGLASGVRFAKYNYTWLSEKYIIYTIQVGLIVINYVLHKPTDGESITGHSKATDKLIETVGRWQEPTDDVVWVFDNYWRPNTNLFRQVLKASWDNVILNEDMKKDITSITNKFFDSKKIYDDLGVPWKRGVIWHGPPGNGKTISLKAMMHDLYSRQPPIVSLYVKNCSYANYIPSIFQRARSLAPCLLIFEDVETIVTSTSRSLFLNEVDGLESNEGIMMIATTNYLERLDPGLAKRPSRFDRKYYFPLPDRSERIQYCNYWRHKLSKSPTIDFPKKLSPAMADLMDDFSFAYMKEAFVATLLLLAANSSSDTGLDTDDMDEQAFRDAQSTTLAPETDGGHNGDDDKDDDDLDSYELWREFKKQVHILREDLDSSSPSVRVTDKHVGHIRDGTAPPRGSSTSSYGPLPPPRAIGPETMNSMRSPVSPYTTYSGAEHSFEAMPKNICTTYLPDDSFL